MNSYTINLKLTDEKMPYSLGDFGAAHYSNKYHNTKLTVIKDAKNSKGQCFNYATKNYKLEYSDDCLFYIKKNYKEISIKDLKINDIIAFFNCKHIKYCNSETVEHFAKVVKIGTSINDLIIRSKWGDCGIYEGAIDDLPCYYGNKVKFYRKIK